MQTETALKLKARLDASSNKGRKPHHDFPTPKRIAREIVSGIFIVKDEDGNDTEREFGSGLDICNDHFILEPSCGHGRFIEAVYADVDRRIERMREHFPEHLARNPYHFTLDAVEVDEINYEIASSLQHEAVATTVHHADFLNWTPPDGRMYDRIVMNPPFNGREFVKHFVRAFSFLKDGGSMTCIMPVMGLDNKDVIEVLGQHSHEVYKLESGEFSESGAKIAALVVSLDKNGFQKREWDGCFTHSIWNLSLLKNSDEDNARWRILNNKPDRNGKTLSADEQRKALRNWVNTTCERIRREHQTVITINDAEFDHLVDDDWAVEVAEALEAQPVTDALRADVAQYLADKKAGLNPTLKSVAEIKHIIEAERQIEPAVQLAMTF